MINSDSWVKVMTLGDLTAARRKQGVARKEEEEEEEEYKVWWRKRRGLHTERRWEIEGKREREKGVRERRTR